MTDAGNQDTSQENQQQSTATQGTSTSKLESQLASVEQMLQSMNRSFEASAAAQVAANQPKPQQTAIPDPTYDPAGYATYMNQQADQIAQKAVLRERELNTVVYDMSQRYPEISTDAGLKKAIQKAQSQLPEAIRGTPQGYKAAILEAVSEAGLVPKDKRAPSLDPDLAMGSSGGSRNTSSQRKEKVSEETLSVAALLAESRGEKLSEARIKSLEQTAQRKRWGKYE